MDWFKVQSNAWMNEKVRSLSPAALRVLLFSWCMASGNETKGHVPGSWLPLLEAKPKLVAELLEVGLWHQNGAGYVIHDWEEHQAEAVSFEARRRSEAERQKEIRRRKREEAKGA